jgi:predicted ATP-dependent serine protease
MDLNYNDIEGFLRLAEQASKRPAKSATQFLNKFNILDAAALASMQLPPLKFLCDKILPSTGLAMLAGPPKAGKSWQVLCMAKDMLKAGKPVFYIAAEDNNRRLRERINSVFITPPKRLICHAGYLKMQQYHGAKMHSFISKKLQQSTNRAVSLSIPLNVY